MDKIKAILLMGGSGNRLSQERPKQFLPLGDRPIYQHTLETFQTSGLFSEIILVTPKEHLVPNCVIGGATRQQSCLNALLACGPDTDYVVIHDAVRPFVTLDILKRNIEAVKIYKAVNTCIPTTDTINYVENETVISIPKRSSCMRCQTPQSFAYSLILEAHQKTKQTNSTDDCALILELGHPVHVVLGAEENFKITTPHDYLIACQYLPQIS